ncbi:MAG UNVERIFIED_CONTAM: hypothetical protein LVQ98_00315 [Rickettsiaceae bacterium]|jgi:hypothetical protein
MRDEKGERLMGIPDKITLSGKVLIKYIDDLSRASVGDVKLYLNDDAVNPFPGDYYNLTDDGYIKCKIYDGKKVAPTRYQRIL